MKLAIDQLFSKVNRGVLGSTWNEKKVDEWTTKSRKKGGKLPDVWYQVLHPQYLCPCSPECLDDHRSSIVSLLLWWLRWLWWLWLWMSWQWQARNSKRKSTTNHVFCWGRARTTLNLKLFHRLSHVTSCSALNHNNNHNNRLATATTTMTATTQPQQQFMVSPPVFFSIFVMLYLFLF